MDHNELYVANKLFDLSVNGAFDHPNRRAMYTQLTLTYAEEIRNARNEEAMIDFLAKKYDNNMLSYNMNHFQYNRRDDIYSTATE